MFLLLISVEGTFVGVDADGELAITGLDRSLDGAAARAASSGVDDVGAICEPGERDLLGLIRRTPGRVVAGGAEVL